MKVIKMLGAALLAGAVFLSVGVNAQTIVPCTWGVTSSYGPPDGSVRYVTQQCKEANNTLVATRSFTAWPNVATVANCIITPATGITYVGSCQPNTSLTFYRNAASSSSAQSSSAASSVSVCTTPNVRVHGGCANSYDSGMLTNPTIIARCGSGCSLEYRTIGWTSACPNSGNARSPEFGLFCK